jgi:hypothetical protein
MYCVAMEAQKPKCRAGRGRFPWLDAAIWPQAEALIDVSNRDLVRSPAGHRPVASWAPSGRDFDPCGCRRNVAGMLSRPRKPSDTNPRAMASRSWRASLIRRKDQVLGDVEAPSREAAEAEMRTFNLSPDQRSRLVVQERV